MEYIYKMTLVAGRTTICTRKVRTKEEGEFQAKEILKNRQDVVKVEYYIKEGEKNKCNPSKEEKVYNYILKTYSQLYETPLKKYPNVSTLAVFGATSKIVDDIESYLNISFNGDRTSLEEGALFIRKHIEDLYNAIEKYKMDLYNADIVDIIDTY